MGFLSPNADGKLPVLLSGGVDSTLCALVGWYVGLEPVGISYEREGVHSNDCEQAEKTCKILGWEFHKVIVPKENPREVFERLVYEYGVNRKTELEILYPFLYLLDKIEELGFDKVVCGFNPSPDNRKHSVWNKKNSKEFWDYIVSNNITSTSSKKVVSVAKERDVIICCPMQGTKFKETLYGLSNEEMNKPYNKSFYKDCFPEKFDKIGMMKVRNRPLQKDGSMTEFFKPIIFDKEINFKNYQTDDVTKCLVSLTQLHSKLDDKKIKKHQKSNEAHRLWVSKNLRNYSESKVDYGRLTKFKPYKLEDVYKQSKKKLFTVVSTFAGGGGSSTGYRLAGGKVLLVNEFVEEAVNTYKANFPDTPVDDQDIRKITRSKKGKEGVIAWFKSFGIKPKSYDILDGSPPCSTFSQAGRGEDKNDKEEVIYSDTVQSNIGYLIFEWVYLALVSLPKICIIENVENIEKSEVFKNAITKLKSEYIFNYRILNSGNYGVPQKRKRLIGIGVRKDIAKKVNIKNADDIYKLYPETSSYIPTVYDALHNVEIDEEERNLALCAVRKSTSYEIVRNIKKDPERVWRLNYSNPKFKNLYFNTNRASWYLPAPTLTQFGNQLGGLGGIFHPTEDRQFTLTELRRLTSLPDDFKLTGSFNQRSERMGRMVCPLMMKAVSESIYEKVLSKL